MVAIITYVSLIIGELVPKQIALRNPEAIAVRAAPFMTVLAKVAAPLVWLLDISGRAVLWLLGQREESEERVTDEEIKMLVAEAEHHGTIESDERRMIAGVMRLGDRAVRAVMTPRTEVDWINLAGRRRRRCASCCWRPSIRACRPAKARSTPWSASSRRARCWPRHCCRQAARRRAPMCARPRSCTTRPTRSTC